MPRRLHDPSRTSRLPLWAFALLFVSAVAVIAVRV
jgi:hypothetical protein